MYLATAGERIRLHGTDDYKRSLEYKPRFDEKKGIALDLSWSPDGRFLGAVCNGWPKVEIIKFDGDYEDINVYRCLNVENPTSIAFSKLGEALLAVGNKEGAVASFHCKSKEDPIIKFPSCKNKVTSLDFSSSDSAVAAGTTNGEVYICGIKSGKLLDKRELNWKEAITSVKFHHSRKGIMAAGCNKGSVTIWDINVGIVEKQFLCHESPCKGIVFSPNNITFMASIGYDFVLNFFDIRSKSIICKSSIPEAGSTLDMHCDGTTLAVGTIRGTVFIYDARKMSSPREKFTSLSGCINKLAFQPSSIVRKRKSRGPQMSLKKQIFKPVDTQLERTGSSTSSTDSLFSPISGGQEPQKRAFKDDMENSLTIDMSSLLPKEEAPIGNNMSDDSVFLYSTSEAPSSIEKLGFMRPLFSATEITYPLEQMKGKSQIEYNEVKHVECISSDFEILELRSKSSERSLKVSQVENLSEGQSGGNHLSVNNVMKYSNTSPVHFAIPKDNSEKSLWSPMVKTPMKTPRLLDLPLIERKMGEACGETVINHFQSQNLLSFLEPLNSTCHVTQNEEVPEKKSYISSKSENLLEPLHLDSLSLNLIECENRESKGGEELNDFSDREVLDILNKYSISKMVTVESNASLTFEESDLKDMNDSKPLACPFDVKKVEPRVLEEEKSDNQQLPLDLKKYMDDMFKDMCYELKKEMSTMHIFNVSAHAKQEILLLKILSELRKEKVDKCIGTDEEFY